MHAAVPQLRIARTLVRSHDSQHATCVRNAANNLACAFVICADGAGRCFARLADIPAELPSLARLPLGEVLLAR